MEFLKGKYGLLLILLLHLSLPLDARANDLTWLGNSTVWANGANWSPGFIPTDADTLYINSTPHNPTITAPGAVANYIEIGYDDNATASLTITGATATLDVSSNLNVAHEGTASLVISEGATVTVDGYLRSNLAEGGNSTILVTGSGTDLSVGTGFYIGSYGTSSLTISEDASVSVGTYTVLGYWENSEGLLSISGNGTSLSSSNSIFVGYYGSGTLTISDGADVSSSSYTEIASKAEGNGTLVVTGTGSSFTSTNDLTIGKRGDGTVVVSDGAALSSDTFLIVGFYAGSEGTLTVTGSGSSVTSGDSFLLGYYGTGTTVISDGATLSSDTYVSTGYYAGSEGNLTITGAGSNITSTLDMYVAVAGDVHVLVSDGGSITAKIDLEVGSGCPSAWGPCYGQGTLVVTGAGSTVDVAVDLYVGESVEGTMTVSNDAAVNVTGTIYVAKGNSIHATDPIGTINIGSASGETAVAAGSITASALSFVKGTGTLVFNHTDTDYEFSIDMSGPGIILAESGTTTLSGDNSGFTGTTSVYGDATLLVTGNLAGTTTISSGGTIGGTGTLNNLTIENEGSYTTAIAVDGTCTALTVTTTSVLDGTLYLDASTNDIYTEGTTYTILTAGALSGTFDTVASNLLFLDGNVTYSATDANVSVFYKDFNSAAQNRTQANVADAIQSLSLGNSFHDALLKQTTVNRSLVQSVFQSSTGSIYTNVRNEIIAGQIGVTNALSGRMGQASGFLTGMDKPLVAHLAGPGMQAMPALWTQVVGGWGQQDGYGGYNYNSYGVLLGSDRPIGDWRIGVAVGYLQSKYDMFNSQGAMPKRIAIAQVSMPDKTGINSR